MTHLLPLLLSLSMPVKGSTCVVDMHLVGPGEAPGSEAYVSSTQSCMHEGAKVQVRTSYVEVDGGQAHGSILLENASGEVFSVAL